MKEQKVVGRQKIKNRKRKERYAYRHTECLLSIHTVCYKHSGIYVYLASILSIGGLVNVRYAENALIHVIAKLCHCHARP